MAVKRQKIYLISNGDFRDLACETCWPKQQETIDSVTRAFDILGYEVEVLPGYDETTRHGFITKQCLGAEIFSRVEPKAPVVIR